MDISVLKIQQTDREISAPPPKRRRLGVEAGVEDPGSSLSVDFEPRHHNTREKVPSANTTRLFSWNINGIDLFLPNTSKKITSFFKPTTSRSSLASSRSSNPRPNGQYGHLPDEVEQPSLRGFLARHKWPEVLFLQELKIKHGDTKALAAILASINNPLACRSNSQESVGDTGHTYTLITVLPRDRCNARGLGGSGKLYGVGTLLREDFAREWVACVREVGWDYEGRVSVVELKSPAHSPVTKHNEDVGGKTREASKENERSKPVALVNVYAVNGTSSPYRSPRTGAVIGTRHDRKLDFHRLLRDECICLQERGYHVVVAGDMNVARGVLDGYPGLRTWPRQHCVNWADFGRKFFWKGGE